VCACCEAAWSKAVFLAPKIWLAKFALQIMGVKDEFSSISHRTLTTKTYFLPNDNLAEMGKIVITILVIKH